VLGEESVIEKSRLYTVEMKDEESHYTSLKPTPDIPFHAMLLL